MDQWPDIKVVRFFIILQNDKNKVRFFIIIGILFGIYCFVFGQSGLLERIRLQNEKIALTEKIKILQKENIDLYNRYTQYQKGQHSQHEAENSGFVFPGSGIIFFKSINKKTTYQSENTKTVRSNQIEIDHFRVIWVTISFFIILFYIIIQQRKKVNIQ